jgi:hypothetical protein
MMTSMEGVMKMISKLITKGYVRLMAASALLTAMASAAAHAQVAGTTGGFGTVADTVNGQLNSVGKLLLGGSFLGGIGFVGHGLVKLKTANDSQGRDAKYADGIWRLAVGGGLVALPTMASMGKTSLFGTNTTGVTAAPSGVTFTGG